ncbi:hypothetical protein SESBI_29493 [Sesbania bispinosa]|nr:hypothetical protein SESBI_29493 [Sesbania bispinosa]
MAMVSVAFHKINSICERRQNWRLRVKLVRVWSMCAVATPSDPYAMQMVFVDEEGGKIEAIVQRQFMKKFSQCLVEGEVYKISNFGVSSNGGKFRASGHDYKLSFTACTQVTKCVGVSIPGLGLSLLKTSDLKKTRGHSVYLVDFMGVVTVVSEELNINKEGRKTRLMLIDLVDEFGKIRFAVFGDFINVVMEFLALEDHGFPVVIIQFARVNLYKGEVGIQNVMNATKILWNPHIPLAVEFKNSLAVHEIETNVSISTITDRRQAPSMRDEFLKLYPKKSIGQLYDMLEVLFCISVFCLFCGLIFSLGGMRCSLCAHPFFPQEGHYIILATVSEIVDDFKWWYMACSCMKGVSFVEGLPFCEDCNRYVFDMTPRYKVKLLVCDGNDNAFFILWDLDCYYLVNKTCRQMLDDIEGQPKGLLPEEIRNLVGKEMLFRIENSHEDLLSFSDTYKIKKVCCDVDIVAQYKEEVADETPLKLKFAPAFPKLAEADANGEGLELSTCCKTIATELEITPPSCVTSSANGEESGSLGKRDVEDQDEAPLKRKKRSRVRAVKVERN